MIAIIEMLVPFALKILGAYAEKKKMSKESKEKFLSFVEAMGNESGESAKLHNSYKAQIERLKKNGNS